MVLPEVHTRILWRAIGLVTLVIFLPLVILVFRMPTYEVGMGFAQVVDLCDCGESKTAFGIELDWESLTTERQKVEEKYYLYDRKSGKMLVFNHFDELVEVQQFTVPGVNVWPAVDRTSEKLGFY